MGKEWPWVKVLEEPPYWLAAGNSQRPGLLGAKSTKMVQNEGKGTSGQELSKRHVKVCPWLSVQGLPLIPFRA